MSQENLTRIEAQERAALLRVERYDIALDLTTGAETFRSETRVRFSASAGAATWIDAITHTVHSVTLNGTQLDPATVSDGTRIQLANLAEENELTIVADFAYTNSGEGLHRFVDPADGEVYLYSQFEVPDSRRVFAVFEQPDLKAVFGFTVVAPSEWKVISNSLTPQPEPIDANRNRWSFPDTPIMSSYITAIIAGPYDEVRSELTSTDGRVIPLGVFARKSLAPFVDADYVFETTRRGFAFFETQFGVPYPFTKYDQLFVPEFNAGAMENVGAVTFTEAYVFRSQVTDALRERRVVTILHELAHMWFGDLVTMRWWNDLWLNESFAEYMSTLATVEASEWVHGWTTFATIEKSWAYRQDQLPSTHPIVAEIRDLQDVQVNFDGITYAKGASVLKQLVAWVGQEAFMAGVHEYFTKHAYGNTELTDLLSELEATSGRDLGEWSAAWLETAGVNTLRLVLEPATASNEVIERAHIEQTYHPDYPTLRPHRIAIGLYELQDGALVRTKQIELDVHGATTPVPELAGCNRPALLLLNDDDLAYAKIRLDAHSASTAANHLNTLRDPLPRALILGSLWDETRDGERSARSFISAALSALGSETESGTIRNVLGQLITAAELYVAPEHRESTLAVVGDALWRLTITAAAGSDQQFQFLRAFASIAKTPAQLGIVQSVFDGGTVLDGLSVDTDLRWELAVALAAGGLITTDTIAELLAADNTASGAQFAAQARAALPTAEAKRAAWDSIVGNPGASNLLIRYTSAGFLRANDPELLAPYLSAYFAQLDTIWQERSFALSEGLITGLFPLPLAGYAEHAEQLRQAAHDWLATHPEPAALRRLIIEELADVERALAGQVIDRAHDASVAQHPSPVDAESASSQQAQPSAE